jgi:hypothetical protein
MASTKGSKVLLLAKCNQGQGGTGAQSPCDFSSVFPNSFSSAFLQLAAAQEEDEGTLRMLVRGQSAVPEEERRRVSVRAQPVDADPCNEFKECHACISAVVSGFKCGWCIGADLSLSLSLSLFALN